MFGLSSLQLTGAVAAVALTIGSVAGYKVRDWQCDAAIAKAAKEAAKKSDAAQDVVDQTSSSFEDFRDDYGKQGTSTIREIREVYHEVEVPGSCAAPPAVVSLLIGRVRAANAAATGQSGSAVPGGGGASPGAGGP